jgi:hypothetical protein
MEPQTGPNDTSHELASDLLRGADKIAELSSRHEGSRRKAYYLCRMLKVAGLPTRLCPLRKAFGTFGVDFWSGEPDSASTSLTAYLD